MSPKVFLIGCLVLLLFSAFFVAYEAFKGHDWKVAAGFMFIGWLFEIGQLASSVK